MSVREPRPFGDVRTSTSVESMVRDLALAHSTRELTHWIDGVVAPRVSELEAFVASHTPADPLAAEREVTEVVAGVEAFVEGADVALRAELERTKAALLADNTARCEAEALVLSHEGRIAKLDAELAGLREQADEGTRRELALEAQIVDLLKVEQVMIKTLRGRGLPEGDEPVTTAQVVEVLRGMGAA